MKQFFYLVFVAFGIATLFLLAVLGPLVSPSHTVIYHTSGPVVSLFEAVLFDLSVLWGLLTVVLVLAEKFKRWQVFLWSAVVILALPLIVLRNTLMLAGVTMRRGFILAILAASLTAFVTLLIFWKPSFLPAFKQVQRFLGAIFVFVALNGIIIVGQLLWYAWQVRSLDMPISLHQRSASSVQHAANPRIIWILLDELSYQQVYGQRFPGLKLPAFDAIAQESTIFTHVIPEGVNTEEVVPALITGVPVDRIRVSSNGRQLSLHNPSNGKWQLFDPHQTVFQDALNAGYSTAVAGWYNPYCRLLPQVLDRCFWTFQLPYPGGIIASQSIANIVREQMVHRMNEASSLLDSRHSVSLTPMLETRFHIADYHDLRVAGDSILADPGANFVFLHMPLPHPGGIYDRRNGALTTGESSYIDNLALADRYLAHVKNLLQQRDEWDSSTIVIMGDHSWRTSSIWSKMEGWTPEDEAASHGAQFDDRPAYIVKFPQQREASRIDAPFKAIHTRALFDALITGKLHSANDLSAWATAQK